MRITISEIEYDEFKKFYRDTDIPKKDLEIVEKLLEKMLDEKAKATSKKKQRAMAKATKKRSEVLKSKITNAINLLRMQGDALTANAVAKEAGVSFNTVKKYKEFIDGIQ